MNDNGEPTRHEYAPTIPSGQASKQLRYEIDTFVDTALEYVQNGREGDAPALAVIAGASIGKTVAVVEATASHKDNPDFKVDMKAPTLALCEEVAEKAKALGITTLVRRGRNQPQPGTTPEQKIFMCARAEAADQLAAAGISVTETLCRQKQADGTFKECPFAATCPHLAQNAKAKSATLVLSSHQYLAIEQEGVKGATLQVIDESFWQVLAAERRIPMDRFTTLRGVGEQYHGSRAERFEDETDLMASVDAFEAISKECQRENRQPTIEDFINSDRARFTEETCRRLAKIEYSHIKRKAGIDIDMDDAEIISRVSQLQIREAIGRARVWTCMADEIATGRTGAFQMLRWEYDLVAEGTSETRNYIVCNWRRKLVAENVPILVIDADGDEEILKKAIPQIESVRINPEWKNFTLIQDFDYTGSKNALSGDRRRDELFNTALQQAVRLDQQVQAGRLKEEPEDRTPILISLKDVIDDYRRGEEEARKQAEETGTPYAPLPFYMYHQGGLRGLDRAKHAAGLTLGGRMEPSVDALESLGRSWFGDDATSLVFVQPQLVIEKGKSVWKKVLPKRLVLVTPKEGEPREIMVSYHPDPRINRILEQIREAELMQAIARVRPVHRADDNPVEIIVLSNVPLRVQPTRFYKWKQIVTNRVQECELDGWIHETSRGMAEAYPDRFSSATAFRMYVSRLEESAFSGFFDALRRGDLGASRGGAGAAGGCNGSYYKDQLTCVTWVRVTFLNGNRAEAGWMKLRSTDTKQSIFDRVKAFHPAAHSFDVTMLEPEVPAEVANVANDNGGSNVVPLQRRHDPRTGIRYSAVSTITLSWAHSREPRWMDEVRELRKKFNERRRA